MQLRGAAPVAERTSAPGTAAGPRSAGRRAMSCARSRVTRCSRRRRSASPCERLALQRASRRAIRPRPTADCNAPCLALAAEPSITSRAPARTATGTPKPFASELHAMMWRPKVSMPAQRSAAAGAVRIGRRPGAPQDPERLRVVEHEPPAAALSQSAHRRRSAPPRRTAGSSRRRPRSGVTPCRAASPSSRSSAPAS